MPDRPPPPNRPPNPDGARLPGRDDRTGRLDAGELPAWLTATRRALDGEVDADVPCDGCTACCEASQFVHIGPDEAETLAHVPEALLVPAPGLPPGHVVMGYDEHGRCPMLVEGGCSIYDHRPRTCRTYDCRVFAATGVVPDEPAKAGIADRVRRWRFATSGSDEDAALRDALARAARDAGRGPGRAT